MSHSIYRSGPTIPADIVTYRHNEKLVYVKPAESYELALDMAQKEFAEDLASVPRDKICFAVTSTFGSEKRHVRISESAWPSAIARLLRGEIVDVYVRGDSNGKEFPPPISTTQFLDVPKVTFGGESSKGKAPSSGRPRSTPTSRAGSPAHRENRRSWFGGAR